MSRKETKAVASGRGNKAAGAQNAFGPGTYVTASGTVEAEGDYRTASLRIPTMRAGVPVPRAFDGTTCFEAGYLVEKNAGWRQVRPIIGADACTGCFSCYMYCPDGAIRKTHAEEGAAVFVDYDFCKGCGICRSVCRFNAIEMKNEAACIAAEMAQDSSATDDAGTEGGAR